MKKKNPFIVIEGVDGTGKGTQLELLKDKFAELKIPFAVFDFPRYGEPSAALVESYLNGKLGGINEHSPYLTSTYYAIDRAHAAADMQKAKDEGKVLLANRLSGSSMAHQGQKIEDPAERRKFFQWLNELEHTTFEIPKPDVNIVLMLDPKVSQKLVDKKEKRDYTDKKRDIHEADLEHLTRAKAVYEEMCDEFGQEFVRIECTDEEGLKTKEKIHELIWSRVGPLVKDQ